MAAEGVLDWLAGKRFLICDRDTTFSRRFRVVLETAGLSLVRTPLLAPGTNAKAERFVRSIGEGYLDRMILFGEGHLRHAIEQYLAHYRRERNHQEIGNEMVEGSVRAGDGSVECDERLGGLLERYWRAA
jgi:transposase InsO family protein